jgi:hypothetical protein
MGAIFGVQVPSRDGHSEASEAQLREGDRYRTDVDLWSAGVRAEF